MYPMNISIYNPLYSISRFSRMEKRRRSHIAFILALNMKCTGLSSPILCSRKNSPLWTWPFLMGPHWIRNIYFMGITAIPRPLKQRHGNWDRSYSIIWRFSLRRFFQGILTMLTSGYGLFHFMHYCSSLAFCRAALTGIVQQSLCHRNPCRNVVTDELSVPVTFWQYSCSNHGCVWVYESVHCLFERVFSSNSWFWYRLWFWICFNDYSYYSLLTLFLCFGMNIHFSDEQEEWRLSHAFSFWMTNRANGSKMLWQSRKIWVIDVLWRCDPDSGLLLNPSSNRTKLSMSSYLSIPLCFKRLAVGWECIQSLKLMLCPSIPLCFKRLAVGWECIQSLKLMLSI